MPCCRNLLLLLPSLLTTVCLLTHTWNESQSSTNTNTMDRTAIWVQTHAIRPERNHGSSSHSRSTSRHNHGLSGSGFVSQHSSQTDLDSEQHPAMSSPTRSRHRYSSRAEPPEHTRSKHHHSSRQHDDYGSQRKEYHDERSNSVRQRRAPCINIPDEAYRNPNLPAFVQGPPGSGYPMNMSSIRTVLPPSPTAAKAIQGPPSPPLKFPAQLNPKACPSDPFVFDVLIN